MKYSKVCIEAITYELAPHRIDSADLEARIAPVYRQLNIAPGQVAGLTGIRQRRFWDAGQTMSGAATLAAQKLLAATDFDRGDIGAVLYCGVCRDNLEPATATAVAAGLGLGGAVVVQDISNACLGALSGIVDIANRIELGQIRAGLVVAAESAREINDSTIERLLRTPSMENFKASLATLTGGSGAVAILVTHVDHSLTQHRLKTAVVRSAPEHHKLCRWGPDRVDPSSSAMVMETDAPGVLSHGVALGRLTWRDFQAETQWSPAQTDRVVCHQVTAGHRAAILNSLEIALTKDFSTFENLGNIGTVSLPLTLGMAVEENFVKDGHRVALLGIGSGLNCLMLGVEW